MNKTIKRNYSAITKRVMRRYLLYWFLLLGALLLLLLFFWLFCRQFLWYLSDPLYVGLKALEQLSPFLILAGMLVGTIIIMYRAIRRSLGYLDITLEGAKKLSEPNPPQIELPVELIEVQNELNLARDHIRANTEAAREAVERKNDLVMYLAHDLKTPLASVIGYLNLLKDTEDLPAETREKYLGITLEKAERLEDLLNEFFEIARFNLSEITLEYHQVDLTRILEQTTFEFMPMLQDASLECNLEITDPIMLRCDPDKIQRVFDNILRNAVTYSYKDSVIRIFGEIYEDRVVLNFRNEGDTIPKEKLDRIFEQFFRADESRSSSGGAGLGLAIAKQIVELHKGTIMASSANDITTFTVILPRL